MAVQKGSEVLVGREDSSFSGSYNLIGGQQSGDLEVTDQTAEYTHKTSPDLWQEIMDGGTSRAVRVNMTGVVVDDAELDAIFAAVMGSSTRHQNYAFLMPGFGMIAATFHNPQFGASGEVNAPEGFTLQGQSAGDITFAPGVLDRYAMQTRLWLNFIEDSYWAGGAVSSTFTGVTGVTFARTGGKTDAGGWGFTSGGTVGTLSEYSTNEPAIHASGGLLVEQSSTNEIRNPRCEGAVAGTPGTLPTNWLFVVGGGVTTTVVGSGTENGWPYVDVQISGTAAGSVTSLYFEASTQIAAVQGDDLTDSVCLKITAGNLDNFTGVRLAGVERTSGGASAGSLTGSTITPDSTRRRYWETFTMAQATAAYWQPRLDFIQGTGAVDLTLRVYAPQSESKAYPTSPIFPAVSSPAATTRNRDDVLLANGSWAPGASDPATLFAELAPINGGASGNFGRLISYGVDDSDELSVSQSQTAGFRADARVSGTGYTGLTDSDSAVGTVAEFAAAVGGGNATSSVTGETQSTATGVPAHTYTSPALGIGQTPAKGGGALRGLGCWVRRVGIFPRFQSNTDLERMVGN